MTAPDARTRNGSGVRPVLAPQFLPAPSDRGECLDVILEALARRLGADQGNPVLVVGGDVITQLGPQAIGSPQRAQLS
jgi:sugar (pentulose or hexulose) kinase